MFYERQGTCDTIRPCTRRVFYYNICKKLLNSCSNFIVGKIYQTILHHVFKKTHPLKYIYLMLLSFLNGFSYMSASVGTRFQNRQKFCFANMTQDHLTDRLMQPQPPLHRVGLLIDTVLQ